MKRLTLHINFLVFFTMVLEISAATHWVISDNGRIQSQLDSIFEMRRPSDLTAFLEQENRLKALRELYEKIAAKEAILDGQIQTLDSVKDVESWLHSSSPGCLSPSLEREEFDFYTSVATDGSWRKGITEKDYMLDEISIEGEKKEPDCKKTFPLDFSVYTFEHLSAMQNRKDLAQPQEKDLIKYLPQGTDLRTFGHRIAHGLMRNSTSWLYLNLAAIYWRINGDTYNALECARRAIVTSPRHSAEAAIVLHTAIDHAPNESHQYLALGHVYAVLGDYNKSLLCYDNTLKIAPKMEQAKLARHVVLCHQRLDTSLLVLCKIMDDAVTELLEYQKNYEDLLRLRDKMLRDHSMKFLLAKLGAERLGTLLTSKERYESCVQREGGDAQFLCSITNELGRTSQIDIGASLQQLQHVENQVQKLNDRMTNPENFQRKFDRSVNIKKATNEEILPQFGNFFTEPAGKMKYNNNAIKKSKAPFENKNWPSEAECIGQSSLMMEARQYTPVHLPPENKGYLTHLFVSTFIQIYSGEEHALPWYPPTCQTPESYDTKNIPSLLLTTASNTPNSPERSLAPFITNLVKGAELAEIGQRILTATKARVAAPWVLSVLASLHWRIIGKPRNALDCLQQALSNVPDKFRDVPLVSIASIGQKLGFIDEALRTAKEALRINSIEPATNYLYATLLHAKGNLTGAIHHLKQSLRVEPDLMEGRALRLLQSLTCEKRLLSTRQSVHGVYGVERIESSGLTCLSPEIIARNDLHEGETVLCVEDGDDCRPIQCFAMKTNVDQSTAP
ncbi:tetratricopeptide repeat protein 17 isoform X2 [Venturia canescens]|uniref:tetratricopeptide repeat protein 17 isoform X2 n=1 Tax=Venturia canescens TaxID=32260 RepID=UPI001C9C93B5|nr:tetratricopeptide repeat protein 17 isoform X2 [Venturia canescens]